MLIAKKEVIDASLLCEVPNQEGDEEREAHNHEEQKASDSGCVPRMRD